VTTEEWPGWDHYAAVFEKPAAAAHRTERLVTSDVCSRWQPQGASHETSRTDTAVSRPQGRDHSGQQHGDRLPPLGRARSVGNLILRSTAVSETAVHDLLTSCGSAYECTSAGIPLSVTAFWVRTVSHAPRNPGRTAWFTGPLRRTSLWREVVDRECVGACRSALVSATGINFQACSFNHSDISPLSSQRLRSGRRQHYRTPAAPRSRQLIAW
jgi:hypothetical protein